MRECLRHPPVRTNVALFFLNTGVEASAGQWAMSLMTEARGLATGPAGAIVAGYWGSVFLGRVVFGVLAHHAAPTTLLRVAMGSIPLAALGLSLSSGAVSSAAWMWVLGFLLAPVFPLLIAETPGRVGPERSAHSIGFQVSAATLGAGLGPATAGVLAGRAGLWVLGPFLLAGSVAVLALHEWAIRPRRASGPLEGS